MSKNKSSRQKTPLDLKQSQDRRLTSKHIQTLIKLDDVIAKNLELESKVNALEQEISSCFELHKCARDAKTCQDQMKSEHRAEIEHLLKDYAQKMKSKEEEFQQVLLNNNAFWEEKVSTLTLKVEGLENTLIRSEEEKSRMLHRLDTCSETRADFDVLSEKLHSSEMEVCQLQDANKIMECQMTELNVSKEKLTSDVALLEKKLATHSTELQKQVELNKRLSSQNELLNEIDKLSAEIDTLNLQKEAKNEEIKEANQNYYDMKTMMEEREKEHFLIKIERDALNQSLNDLNVEYHALKEKLSSLGGQMFSRKLNASINNTKSKQQVFTDKETDKPSSKYIKKVPK